MRSRIGIGLIAGVIGGFLGWLLQENLIHYAGTVVKDVLTGEVRVVPLSQSENSILIVCVGGLIGLFLGAVNGIVESNGQKLIKGIVVGAIAGILLGSIGFTLGGHIYNLLGGSDSIRANPSPFAFVQQVIARSFGWALMGLGLGVGSSLATLSGKRIRNGAIGGFIGGFLGGFVFDMVGQSIAPVHATLSGQQAGEVGGPSRAIGFTAIGGLTGLFIGLVEELLKQAWVKVLAGRNEGKEYVLYNSTSLMGRDERCDIPLFGDMSVGVQHAAIRTDGRRHLLIAADTPSGTMVNGQRVTPNSSLLLRDGDMIQIASHRVLFHEKATESRLSRPNADNIKSGSPSVVQVPSYLCQFCGATKDPNGTCQCNIGMPDTMPQMQGYGNTGAAMSGTPPMMQPSSMGSGMQSTSVSGYTPLDPSSGGSLGVPAYSRQASQMGGYGSANSASGNGTQLIGVEGPYSGQVFPLMSANIVVGREPDKDIVLSADTTISRSHAQLVHDGANIIVYDNGSSNGTFVNGQRVTMPTPLVSGDIVQFGSSKFRFD